MLRFLRRQKMRWLILLGLTELLLLAASLYLAMYLRYFRSPEDLIEFSHRLPLRSLIFSLVILLGMAAMGEYRTHMRTSWLGIAARQAVAFMIGGLLLIVGYYVVPQAYIGRGVLGLALVLGFAAVMAFRVLFMRLVENESFKPRVLILGTGQRAAQIHNRMRRRSDRRGFTIVGYVPCPDEDTCVPSDQVLALDVPLATLVKREQINEIVVGVDDRRGRLPMGGLLQCRQSGVMITDLTTFFERESGRVQLSWLEPSWLVFSGGFNATPLHRLTKRCFGFACCYRTIGSVLATHGAGSARHSSRIRTWPTDSVSPGARWRRRQI